MTEYRPTRKGTILIPSGPVRHLFFVCSDPTPDPVYVATYNKNAVLVVNISTIKEDAEHDNSCVLNVGEHPFITDPSYVVYIRASLLSEDNITDNIADGTFDVHEDCCEETLQKIYDGFEISEDTPGKILKFFRKYCK